MGRASVPTPAVYPAFFFVLEKAVKSAGNAVIPTSLTRWSHGLRRLWHERLIFAFADEIGYTLGFRRRIAHNGLHGETGGHPCVVARSIWLRPHHLKNSRRKRLHAYGVCPLSPAPQPRWAVGTYSFVTAWSFLHRYQSGQQREFSIKTIRRPNVHCKTKCILLQ